MKRLAVITTHPIQYNAPWFRLLTEKQGALVKVFYTKGDVGHNGDFDTGFGKVIKWDIPLLKGYEYAFVKNVSRNPGVHGFRGIRNPSLNQEVSAWKPDAVLVIGWSFYSHLHCMRYFRGRMPVLFRGDSTLLDESNGWRKVLRRLFLKWVYRHIDIALYTGTNNKAYFIAHGLKEHQLVFAPHAIDNTRFSEGDLELSEKAKRWRHELGFKDDDIVILFAGKLEPKKDPGILLEAAKQLDDDRIKFVLVGNGVLEKELKKQAISLPSVRFVDFQNQSVMPVVYRLGDIFVLPSKGPGETWGLALNEAMASGVPVLASDKVGGAIDLIKPGLNGDVFQAGDLQDFLEKLLPMIDRPKLRAMGRQSVKQIEAWNFDRIVTSIRSVLSN